MLGGVLSRAGSTCLRRLLALPDRGTSERGAPAAVAADACAPSPIAAGSGAADQHVHLLEAIVDNFPGGISLFDKDLRMVLCNGQQKRLLEYPEDLFASGWPTLEQIFRFNAKRGEYGPGDVEEHVRLRMALVRERRAYVLERTRPNGTALEIRGVPIEGGGFLTTYLDVTEQRRTQALVAHMAHHDALTSLPNRLLFRDRLQQALARVRRGEVIALLYLDLDRFKPVNDSHGHAVGDALLQAVSERLCANARDTDTVARLGGDEFVLIQVGIREVAEAAALARRLTRVLAQPYQIAGTSILVSASVGIAMAPADGVDPEELLKKADHALYLCKADGRGSFTFFRASDGHERGCGDAAGSALAGSGANHGRGTLDEHAALA